MGLASSRLLRSSLLRTSLVRSCLLVPLALAGCSEGENDDDLQATTAPVGTSSMTSVTGETSSGSTAPTTGAPTSTTTTGDEPTGSSTAAGTTTTGDDTTTTTESTGPICDPGQGNCVCDDGQCADGFVCEQDVCVAALVCPGDLEPGDDGEETATNVGDITDDDGEQFTVSGVLSGSGDVDWYTYHAKDTFGYIAEPTLKLVEGTQRMCQFLVCDEGGAALTTVTCPDGSKFAISPMLRPGCCASTSFTIGDFNCKGQDESATVWIRVDQPEVDECSNYELQLNF